VQKCDLRTGFHDLLRAGAVFTLRYRLAGRWALNDVVILKLYSRLVKMVLTVANRHTNCSVMFCNRFVNIFVSWLPRGFKG
jgi:hypothetical protein